MDNDDKAAGRRKRRQAGPETPAVEPKAGPALSEPGLAANEPAQAPVSAEPDIPPAEPVTPAGDPPAAAATPWAEARGEPAAAVSSEPESVRSEPEAFKPETAAPGPDPEPPLPLDLHPEERRKSSPLPLLAAALIGGVVGGVLVLGAGLAGLGPGGGTGGDALSPRLAALEQELASTRQTLEQTTGRTAAAEMAAKGAAENATNAINLAAEAKAAAGGTPAELGPLTGRLDDADKALATLRASVDSLGKEIADAAGAAAQAQADAAAAQTRMAALEKAVAASNPDRVAAYAVALSQLGEAVRAGRPFEPELKAALALGGDNAKALEVLAPLAARGTPTLEALKRSFAALAPQLAGILAPPPAPAAATAEPGLVDKFLSSFGGVVSVTRDDSPDALEAAKPVKAVSEALEKDDLPAALAAFDAMPETARVAGAAWLVDAKGSFDANALVRAESAAALKTLSGK